MPRDTRFMLSGELWKDADKHFPVFYDLEHHLRTVHHFDVINPARWAESGLAFNRNRPLSKTFRKRLMLWTMEQLHDEDTVGVVMLPEFQATRGAMAHLTLARFYEKGIIAAFPRPDGTFWFNEIDGVTPGGSTE